MWMLEEVRQPYELVEKSTNELQTPEYLQLNPNVRIPTLVDDGVVIWESIAINLYPAQKYPMHSSSPSTLGLAAQWSFWAGHTAIHGSFACVAT
jgi:glutathione S-transferase